MDIEKITQKKADVAKPLQYLYFSMPGVSIPQHF